MDDPKTKNEELTELSEQEQELLTYYRCLTSFTQQRVFSIVRNSYADIQRAAWFRYHNGQVGKKS